MGLAGAVVRILAQQDDVHVPERRELQRPEDLLPGRIDGAIPVLRVHELLESPEVGLPSLVRELGPAVGDRRERHAPRLSM